LRVLLFLAVLVPSAAFADLYRWVDPETGSVKFSNYPPLVPVAKVERIPYAGPAPARVQAPVAPAANALAGLIAQWRQLRLALDSVPAQGDSERAGAGFAQHAQAYNAVRAELDRIDPAGAARRRAEDEPLLIKLSRGMKAQVGAALGATASSQK